VEATEHAEFPRANKDQTDGGVGASPMESPGFEAVSKTVNSLEASFEATDSRELRILSCPCTISGPALTNRTAASQVKNEPGRDGGPPRHNGDEAATFRGANKEKSPRVLSSLPHELSGAFEQSEEPGLGTMGCLPVPGG
jgi:hypothetical protein